MDQKGAKFIKKLGIASKKSHTSSFQLQLPPPEQPQPIPQPIIHIPKHELPNFTVIAPLRNQIFCIYSSRLQLYGSVDQHAMHERVRYEYYCWRLQGEDTGDGGWRDRFMEKREQRRGIEVVGERVKELMYVGKIDAASVNRLASRVIEKYGLRLQIEQDGNIHLHSHSKILTRTLQPAQLKKISLQMIQLQTQASNRLPATLDNLLAESACKSAIKFGDPATLQWCEDLLYNAGLCRFPWECVHGRPTVHFVGYRQGQGEGEERVYGLE